ncbi:glycoprotein vOX2-2A [Elephant endotheliotropic herpesvirus 2]|nr:glycoprotein vOX2-2A [Elephant endotheliotropic herpesvirus 2]
MAKMDLNCIFKLLLLLTISVTLVRCEEVTTQDHLVPVNTSVTLSCVLSGSSREPIIVAWQHNTSGANIVVLSKNGNPIINSEYANKTKSVRGNDMRSTNLTFISAGYEDEGCFVCTFYFSGNPPTSFSNKTCLSLYVYPTISISNITGEDGSLNVTCTGTARPPPTVTWFTNGPETRNSTHNNTNPDQTTSVSSTLYFQSENSTESYPYYCLVEFLTNTTESLTWNGKPTPSPKLQTPAPQDSEKKTPSGLGIGIVVVVIVVLALIVIIYYYYTKIHKRKLQSLEEPPGYKKLPVGTQ